MTLDDLKYAAIIGLAGAAVYLAFAYWASHQAQHQEEEAELEPLGSAD